jgi:hypothetical protein
MENKMKLKKQKFEYLPYRVEMNLGYNDWTLEEKIVSLAGRNHGQQANDYYSESELVIDFADETGFKTFCKKVQKRYPDVELDTFEATPVVEWEDTPTPKIESKSKKKYR